MVNEKKYTPTKPNNRGEYRKSSTSFRISYLTSFPLPCKVKNPEGETVGQKATILKALSGQNLPSATTLQAIADSCNMNETQTSKALRALRHDRKLKYIVLPAKTPIYVIEEVSELPDNICRFTGGVCSINNCLFVKLCQSGSAVIEGGIV